MLFQTKLIFYDVSLSSGSALMYYPLMESTLANQECCALSLKSCKLFLGEYCTPDARARDRPYTGRGGEGILIKIVVRVWPFQPKKGDFLRFPNSDPNQTATILYFRPDPTRELLWFAQNISEGLQIPDVDQIALASRDMNNINNKNENSFFDSLFRNPDQSAQHIP